MAGAGKETIRAARITGIASIIAALIGAGAGFVAGRSTTVINNILPAPEARSSQTVIASVPSEAGVGDGTGASSSGSASGSASADAVRRVTSTPLTLAIGGIDLDSLSQTWEFRPGSADDTSYDLLFDGAVNRLQVLSGGGDVVTDLPANPTREACANSTQWAPRTIDTQPGNLPIRFCMKTTANRYAYLTVLGEKGQPNERLLTLSIKVWEQPSS